jgi:hypothetical protein
MIAIGGISIIPTREQRVDFTAPHFQEGQRLLVKNDSEIQGLCDLHLKAVAVISNSIGATYMISASTHTTDSVQPCDPGFSPTLKFHVRHSDAINALFTDSPQDKVDAFITDGLTLGGYAENESRLKVVGNEFGEAFVGFAVREQDGALQHLLNATLDEMGRDGTLQDIFWEWRNKIEKRQPFPYISDVPDPNDIDYQPMPSDRICELIKDKLPNLFTDSPGSIQLPIVHTVQPGEWLSGISGEYCGGVSKEYWEPIQLANADKISNPDVITEGWELIIPADCRPQINWNRVTNPCGN